MPVAIAQPDYLLSAACLSGAYTEFLIERERESYKWLPACIAMHAY